MSCQTIPKSMSQESVTVTSPVFDPERFVAEIFPVNVAPDNDAFAFKAVCKSV